MNQKELGELRRRFRPDKSAVSRIHGCYVNANKEIVSYLDESLGMMPQDEAEKYLGLLKKALSGTLGRNLIDIVFSTQQVADSEEHRLLSALRKSELKDSEVRKAFYEKVINAIDMGDSNFVILLAHDAYDVPHRGKDDEVLEDGSETVFSYIVCCICPVKDGKVELGYFPGENEFHNCASAQIISAPELGFMFPAFDDRAANIYNALFYSRKPEEIHHEFIDAVFKTEPPLSAAEQKAAFQAALTEGLEAAYDLELAQAIHEQLSEKIEAHKESKNPEPLSMMVGEISAILSDYGVDDVKVAAFQSKCAEHFGAGSVLTPANLIDNGKFQIKSGEISITIPPEQSYLVESRAIDGKKYILIPAGETVEVNGQEVGISAQ